MRSLSSALVASLLLAGVAGCKDGPEAAEAGEAAEATSGDERVWPADDRGRCDTGGEHREVSEYDTSGDDHPDVRKVFVIVGEGAAARLVLTCREADLNDDGYKDIVRRYNDEGRPLREEADRDFDGRIDETTFYEEGRIGRREVDADSDGHVDAKTFYDESGEPLRTERDLAHRSTADRWQPDRWEYFEAGRTVRVGSDLDGDGRVDRWDRDSHRADPRAPGEEAPEEGELVEGEAVEGETVEDDAAEEASDAGAGDDAGPTATTAPESSAPERASR